MSGKTEKVENGESAANVFAMAESAVLRNETYASAFRRMTILSAICVAIGGAGLAAGIWGATRQPETSYFATQEGHRILPLVALDRPYLSQDQILSFTGMCTTRALTLSFSSWQSDIDAAKSCFTSAGWDAFITSVTESGTLDFITKRRLNSTAMVAGASVVEEGRDMLAPNRYVWRVKTPISINFESASEKSSQIIEALVEVVRTETYENDHGIAISRFIAQAK